MEISLIITGAIVGISIYIGLTGVKRDFAALVFTALKCWNEHQRGKKEITLDYFVSTYAEAKKKFKLF